MKRTGIRNNSIRKLRQDEPIPDMEPRRYKNGAGYIRLRWKIAPRTYVEEFEHRVVMGRPEGMDVHHLNHIKDDNRPENLHVLTRSAHATLHERLAKERNPLRGVRPETVPRGVPANPGSRIDVARRKRDRVEARRAKREALISDMRAAYEGGASTIEIGQRFHLSAGNVSRALRQGGTTMRPAGRHTSARRDTGPTRNTRHAVKNRARLACERCGKNLAWEPSEIQHRRARGMGGSSLCDTNSAANLVLFCRPCHAHVETNPLEAEEEGWRVRQGKDPAVVPILHHEHGPVLLAADYTYEELASA